MRVERATARVVSHLWAETRPRVAAAECLEGAAQELVGALAVRFLESVVLVRTFASVGFAVLPEPVQAAARGLASGADALAQLDAETPVLALLGSHGVEPEWCDRRLSKGHAGIPLISSAFVEGIPMIAGLLEALGVPLEWADSRDAAAIQQTVGKRTGHFFVADAALARDARGRPLVGPDFVARYDIGSVFGFGGADLEGRLLVTVVFCRDQLSSEAASAFTPLMDLFAGETRKLSEAGRVFAG